MTKIIIGTTPTITYKFKVVDAGDMDVEYRADTKLYIDKRLGV